MKLKKKQIFPKSKFLGKRLWGKEELLVLIPRVLTLKKLTINKNSKGGLQYHRLKNECGILLSGKMKVIYMNKKKKTYQQNTKSRSMFSFFSWNNSSGNCSKKMCNY